MPSHWHTLADALSINEHQELPFFTVTKECYVSYACTWFFWSLDKIFIYPPDTNTFNTKARDNQIDIYCSVLRAY